MQTNYLSIIPVISKFEIPKGFGVIDKNVQNVATVHIVTCSLYTPLHYDRRGQGSSAALHMEYTDGRVPLPSRM